MKTLIFIGLTGLLALTAFNWNTEKAPIQTQKTAIMTTDFYSLSIPSLDGKDTIHFSDFKGKKVLCVNTASECGYTYQYGGLEELYEMYKDKLVVIGFPCNQFGHQEPGSPEEIGNFCQKNYGVNFLLSEKIDVKGDNQHPVYQWLTQKSQNGVGDYTIKWNFNKFLIDENGHLIGYYESGVKPLDDEITSHLK
ncbi:MAG: glutathione peroxidase [Bacteroidetes bacterium]|nr:glutathione peroxidase [Bacteroidota bacterium]